MVARIELAPEVVDDFERILYHLEQNQSQQSQTRIADILETIGLLEHNPLIGRPTTNGMRELVIGQGTRGYVALYRYLAEMDVVFVLAIRGQREAGFSQPIDR
ncbi:plasmid stabilization protein [Pseudomonas sp. PA1(2017)]|uniref:type II toxin-antitoxin system RelE/ParE family toxin n=1 Tax=Pseudomonas sp. PA1(2017) TaxID=1932113 RepID=UPI00095E5553|nr:type II toxin-antitoxin system RelE/ParE family toxin [Pseudomonas sp. PA1(2017)]OLU16421.1 plasmid stabilization protein [Pseudomonas sp. PA1(2017)]